MKTIILAAALVMAMPAFAQDAGGSAGSSTDTSAGATTAPTDSSAAAPAAGADTMGGASATTSPTDTTGAAGGAAAADTSAGAGAAAGMPATTPVDSASLPTCSRTVTDRCIEKGSRGHHAARHRAR